MQWQSFTNMEKVMLKLQNSWIWTVQRCGRSWRSSRRPETTWTNQGAEENKVSALFNSSKTRGKRCDETFTEAAEPWPSQPVWANPPCTRCKPIWSYVSNPKFKFTQSSLLDLVVNPSKKQRLITNALFWISAAIFNSWEVHVLWQKVYNN